MIIDFYAFVILLSNSCSLSEFTLTGLVSVARYFPATRIRFTPGRVHFPINRVDRRPVLYITTNADTLVDGTALDPILYLRARIRLLAVRSVAKNNGNRYDPPAIYSKQRPAPKWAGTHEHRRVKL